MLKINTKKQKCWSKSDEGNVFIYMWFLSRHLPKLTRSYLCFLDPYSFMQTYFYFYRCNSHWWAMFLPFLVGILYAVVSPLSFAMLTSNPVLLNISASGSMTSRLCEQGLHNRTWSHADTIMQGSSRSPYRRYQWYSLPDGIAAAAGRPLTPYLASWFQFARERARDAGPRANGHLQHTQMYRRQKHPSFVLLGKTPSSPLRSDLPSSFFILSTIEVDAIKPYRLLRRNPL